MSLSPKAERFVPSTEALILENIVKIRPLDQANRPVPLVRLKPRL